MKPPVFRLPPWRRAGPVLLTLSPQERDWGLRQFKIPRIWEHTRGAGVRIAVLDTGVDEDHVISMGFGSPMPVDAVHAAIQTAVAAGTLVIAAAGENILSTVTSLMKLDSFSSAGFDFYPQILRKPLFLKGSEAPCVPALRGRHYGRFINNPMPKIDEEGTHVPIAIRIPGRAADVCGVLAR